MVVAPARVHHWAPHLEEDDPLGERGGGRLDSRFSKLAGNGARFWEKSPGFLDLRVF